MKDIKIVVKEPGKAPESKMVPNTVEAQQEIVGGYFQQMPGLVLPNVAMYANEDGRMMGLQPHLAMPYGIVVGSVFVAKWKGTEMVSLSDEECKQAVIYLNDHEILPGLAI